MYDEYDNLYQLRDAIGQDLTDKAHALREIEAMTQNGSLEMLMPPWKWQRFKAAIRDANAAVLRAIDCLSYKESPTIDALLNEIIWRYACATPGEEKDHIINTLREAFKKQSSEKKP